MSSFRCCKILLSSLLELIYPVGGCNISFPGSSDIQIETNVPESILETDLAMNNIWIFIYS